MADPLTIAFAVSSIVSAGAGLIESIFGGSDFDVTERINRLFDQRLSTGLFQISSGSSRRLTGAGLEGSGVINQIILDNQQRFTSQLEQQREQALIDAEQLKFQSDIFNQQNRQGAFGGLAELGLNLAQFSSSGGFGGGQQSTIENPFSDIVSNSLVRNQVTGFGQPQSLKPRPPITSQSPGSDNLAVSNPLEFVSNANF